MPRKSPTFSDNIICPICGKEEQRTGSVQTYCKECARKRAIERKQRWYIDNYPDAYKSLENKEVLKCQVCGSDYKVCSFRGEGQYCQRHYNQMYKYGHTFEGKKKSHLNEYHIEGDTVKIVTVRGEEFLVDAEDVPKIEKYYWSLNTQGYVITVYKGKITRLTKFIMGEKPCLVVDHINGNLLDNRKINLRWCTPQENSRNCCIPKNNRSGVVGVGQLSSGKWRARIMFNRKEINLGHYEKFEDAVAARREGEKKYFGEFARSLEKEE